MIIRNEFTSEKDPIEIGEGIHAEDTVGLFLRDLGEEALKPQQQKALFLVIHNEVQKILQENPEIDASKSKSNKEIIEKFGEEAAEAFQKCFESNIGLVIFVAKKYNKTHLPLSDIISMGYMGLVRAIIKYNPHADRTFATYAFFWIQQAIRRKSKRELSVVRIPEHIYEIAARIKTVLEDQNLSHLQRERLFDKELPPDPEIRRRVSLILSRGYCNHMSMYTNKSEDKETALVYTFENCTEPVHEAIDEEDEKEYIKDFISSLRAQMKPREYLVIRFLQGRKLTNEDKSLLNPKELQRYEQLCQKQEAITKLEDIGFIFGVTKEAIRQTKLRAIKIIQDALSAFREVRGHYQN